MHSIYGFLKNPSWTPSILEPSPILNDNLTWGARDEQRHKIRVVNFCNWDTVFGDIIACLTE